MRVPMRNRRLPDAASAARGGLALALLTAAYVLSYIDRTVLSLLVGPIRAALDLSDTQFSLLGGLAFAIFYSTLGIPLGWWADRGNRRVLIALGIAVWSAMTVACGLAGSFMALFLARVGVGIGEAALSPAAYSLIADLFPAERIGRAIAIYGSGVYLGIGLSFLAGGWLVDALTGVQFAGHAPWQIVFFIVGAPGLVLAGAVLLFLPEPRNSNPSFRRKPESMSAGHSDFQRAAVVDSGVRRNDSSGLPLLPHLRTSARFLALHFAGFSMLTLAFNGYLAWLAEYFLRGFGWAKADSGTAIGLVVLIAGMGGMLLSGHVSDLLRRRGDPRAAMTAALAGAALLLPLPFAVTTTGSATISLVLFAPVVFLSAFCFGPAVVALQLATPAALRARVSAVYLLVVNLTGIGLGGTAVALVSDRLLQDEARLGEAMAMVGVGALLLAVPLLWRARAAMPADA
jgi:MFS family permease